MGRPTTSTRGCHHLAHRGVAQVVEGGEDQLLLILPRDHLSCRPRPGRDPGGRSSGESSRRRNTPEASRQLPAAADSPPPCAPSTTARTGTGWKDSSWKVPPSMSAVVALPEPDRVQRLHDPALGTRALGQEDVGTPVEQHQHRYVGEVAVGLFQAELEAHGHAPHASHLQVDDDQVGLVLVDGRGDGMTRVDLDDVGTGFAHHRHDVGPHRRGVAGHHDRAHGVRLTGADPDGRRRGPGPGRASPSLPEDMIGDEAQPLDVVHVHVEQGHQRAPVTAPPGSRGRRRRPLHAGSRPGSPGG